MILVVVLLGRRASDQLVAVSANLAYEPLQSYRDRRAILEARKS